MGLGTPLVQRVWTVELRHRCKSRLLVCPACSPGGRPIPGNDPRTAVLEHLARHARRSVRPPHLRTCQCFERGCRWHTRHRGCCGSIVLALSRIADGRIWRLADVCAACAHVMVSTAVVPDIVPGTLSLATATHPPSVSQGDRSAGLRCRSSEQKRVKEMLSYLASTLPAWTGPEGRLLAVLCGLRADRHGRVQLRRGTLRSIRLAHSTTPWLELEGPTVVTPLPCAAACCACPYGCGGTRTGQPPAQCRRRAPNCGSWPALGERRGLHEARPGAARRQEPRCDKGCAVCCGYGLRLLLHGPTNHPCVRAGHHAVSAWLAH
jgi:hypothetical protein